MVYFVLLMQSILGWSLLYNRLLKCSYNLSLPIVGASILSITYYANLFGYIKASYHALYYIGLLLFYALLLYILINKKFKEYFTSDLLVFLGLSFVFYLRFKNSYYLQWDNLTNWGIPVKELNLFDGFSSDQSLIRGQYAEYPNGVAAFIYFITKTLGFSEGHAIFGHSLLFLLFASSLLVTKKILPTTCLLVVAITLGVVCNPGIGSLYIDGMVGASAGALFITYLQIKDRTRKNLLILLPFFIAVPAIKQVGLVLVIILSIIIAIDLKTILPKQNKRLYIVLLFLVLVTLITADSWPHLSPYSSHVYNLPSFYKKLIHIYENMVGVSLFYKIIFSLLKGFVFSFRYTFMIVASLSIIFSLITIYKLDKPFLLKQKRILVMISLGILLYFGHRTIVYMTALRIEEALTSAGLKRYLGSYIMVLCFVSMFYLRKTLEKYEFTGKGKKYCALAITACLLLTISRLHSKPKFLPFDEDRALVLSETSHLIRHKKAKAFVIPDSFTQHHCALYYFNTSFSGIYMNSELCFNGSRYNDHGKIDSAMDEYRKLLIADDFNIEKGKDPNKYDLLFIPRPSKKLWEALDGRIYISPDNRSKKLFVRSYGNKFVPVSD